MCVGGGAREGVGVGGEGGLPGVLLVARGIDVYNTVVKGEYFQGARTLVLPERNGKQVRLTRTGGRSRP